MTDRLWPTATIHRAIPVFRFPLIDVDGRLVSLLTGRNHPLAGGPHFHLRIRCCYNSTHAAAMTSRIAVNSLFPLVVWSFVLCVIDLIRRHLLDKKTVLECFLQSRISRSLGPNIEASQCVEKMVQ